MDGLSAVVPYADPHYATERDLLAITPPGTDPDSCLDLDGFFGLNPRGAALQRMYGDGELLFVHGTGLNEPNRSHFDAQIRMEAGSASQSVSPASSGWIGRHLDTTPALGMNGLRGVGLDTLLPATFTGGPGTLPISDISGYDFPGRASTRASRRALMDQQYAGAGPLLSTNGMTTLSAIDLLDAIDFQNYVPRPDGGLPGERLRNRACVDRGHAQGQHRSRDRAPEPRWLGPSPQPRPDQRQVRVELRAARARPRGRCTWTSRTVASATRCWSRRSSAAASRPTPAAAQTTASAPA